MGKIKEYLKKIKTKTKLNKTEETNTKNESPVAYQPVNHTQPSAGQPLYQRDSKVLLIAATQNNFSLMQELVALGGNLEIKNELGQTPLMLAAAMGHIEMVKWLLLKGALVNSKDQNGNTPLSLAAFSGHLNVVEFLVSQGASMEHKNNNGSTPFVWSASSGKTHVVNFFLEWGADIESKGQNGNTALVWSSCYGHLDVVKLLCEKGANLEAKNNHGDTALTLAAWYGHNVDVVKFLLEKGANVNAQNNDHETALSLAQKTGRVAEANAIKQWFGKNSFSERLKRTGYAGEIPPSLLCPIGKGMMDDPVTVSSGCTYDRVWLASNFASKGNPASILCPVTGRPIQYNELNNGTNITIKNALEKFVSAKEHPKPIKAKNKKEARVSNSGHGIFNQNQNQNQNQDTTQHSPLNEKANGLKVG